MAYMHGTTILGVRRDGIVVMGSDGQVSLQDTIMKENAKKVQSLHNGEILVGFAGAVADALTLFSMFEEKIDKYPKNLPKAIIEFAKSWRKDKYLRKLEALLGVMDKEDSFILSGSGEVIKPDDGIVAIGSGGGYALSAARGLLEYSSLDARTIVEVAIKLASRVCVYTNDNISIEVIEDG
ncbi:MAG: ATP-dependent protease subunit HslV [candidate division WOR-3 bacterium]|nr:ATP-dependent protease subunit HslV [candidate division WOR-3 bacterium]